MIEKESEKGKMCLQMGKLIILREISIILKMLDL